LTGLFPRLSGETRKILDGLPGLIDEVFPMPGRFRAGLPGDVAELSRLLTSERANRVASYLGKPPLLSAYLRYFLPWNIYRLSRLFSTLPLELKPNDALNDLGTGPLTLAASLWISRPALRSIPLEFRCLDRTQAVLEAGKKFFAALSGKDNCPWTIKTIRGEIRRNGSLSVVIRGKPAALSAAINVYNELFWDFTQADESKPENFAESHARLLSALTETQGSVLVVEPGIPRSGEFISLLRSSLMKEGRIPFSPCTHPGACPLPGGRSAGKAKWCHFAFDTGDAPEELHRLSAASRLPKERAVLSFILAGPSKKREPVSGRLVKIRIISDSFPVGGETEREKTWGRYGCSECGLVLVTGSRRSLESSPPGTLEELQIIKGLKDAKSGGLIAEKN
jgi:hypothetical protein